MFSICCINCCFACSVFLIILIIFSIFGISGPSSMARTIGANQVIRQVMLGNIALKGCDKSHVFDVQGHAFLEAPKKTFEVFVLGGVDCGQRL